MTRLEQLVNVGLAIENRGVILPWGASKGGLAKICKPDSTENSEGENSISWGPCTILGGLQVMTLEVCFPPRGRFDSADAWLERGYSEPAAIKAFQRAANHLSRFIGKPVKPVPADFTNFDIYVDWKIQNVEVTAALRLGPEFGDYSYTCNVYINWKPDKPDVKVAQKTAKRKA